MIRRVSKVITSAVLLVSVSPAAFGQSDAQQVGRRQKEPVEVIHREKQDPNARENREIPSGSRQRNEQPDQSRGKERRERP